MPTNVLGATGVVANGQQGLISTLPHDGLTYTGHDPNSNTCRVWRDAAGMLQKDANINVVWLELSVRRALALTDSQLRLQCAAGRLPRASRDWFLQVVAQHLTSEVSDGALMAAINNAYDRAAVIDGIKEAV